MFTTRTTSPYFSLKSAVAPAAFACSRTISSMSPSSADRLKGICDSNAAFSSGRFSVSTSFTSSRR